MNYTYINNNNDIHKVYSILPSAKYCGIDIETTELDVFSSTILLLQLNLDNNIFIINCKKVNNHAIRYIIQMIKDTNKIVIGHNIKFDLKVIYKNFNELLTNVYDTQLGEILSTPNINNLYPSLEDLVYKYCFIELNKNIRKTFIGYNSDEFTQEQILYSAMDVKFLIEIMEIQLKNIEKLNQKNICNLEMNLVPVFSMMEYTGINIDIEKWKENVADSEKRSIDLKYKIVDTIINSINIDKFKNTLDLCNYLLIPIKTKKLQNELKGLKIKFGIKFVKENININSPKQLLNILKLLGISIENTNEKTLIKYKDKHELIKLLLEYREAEKQVTTYGYDFLKNINIVTGKLHTEFNQLGTATGRISSSNPNLQNIPRIESYRRCFIAPEGYKIITADYSQAELRLMASVSCETEMINAFINDEDLHAKSASVIVNKSPDEITKEERQIGKTLNFGLIYGISEYGLYNNFNIPIEVGKDYLNKYFSKYKILKIFMDKAGELIYKNKYSITPFGRKRYFEDKTFFKDVNEARSYESRIKRQGINHIIQGGIADVVKIAMLDFFIKNPFGYDLQMLLQVHDEIVFLVKDEIAENAAKFISDIMVDAGKKIIKKVPVIVDYKIEQHWSK